MRTQDKYYKELQTLYFVIKVLLVSKNVHKPWKGGMGSFVLINLITSFLQDEYKKKLEDTNDRDMHYLVTELCKFIGFEFKHKDVGVSILQGGFFFDRNDEKLRVGDSIGVQTPMIVNPLSPFEDLGTSVRIFSKVIKPLFQTAANVLSTLFMSKNLAKITDPPVSFIELIVLNARTLRDKSVDV